MFTAWNIPALKGMSQWKPIWLNVINLCNYVVSFDWFGSDKGQHKYSVDRPNQNGSVERTRFHTSMESYQKGPTRHAYAWQIGPFWQDTLDITKMIEKIIKRTNNSSDTVSASIPRHISNKDLLKLLDLSSNVINASEQIRIIKMRGMSQFGNFTIQNWHCCAL